MIILFTLLISLLLEGCGGGGGSEPSGVLGESGGGNGTADASNNPQSASITPKDCAEEYSLGEETIPITFRNFASSCDYYVKSTAKFTNNVTIEPGTVFLMAKNASFKASEGSFEARGTVEEPIVFRGEIDSAGSWGGVQIWGTRKGILENVKIIDGGRGDGYGLHVRETTITLKNVDVSKSFGVGLRLGETITIEEFSSNRFFGNELFGLEVANGGLDVLAALDASSDYYGEGDQNRIPLIRFGQVFHNKHFSSHIEKDAYFKLLNAPYFIDSAKIEEGHKLTIDPGVTLFLKGEGSILSLGDFKAIGTADKPIYIGAHPGENRAFGHIAFYSSAELSNVTIENGGEPIGRLSGPPSDSDHMIEATDEYPLNIKDSTIKNSKSWAISCHSATEILNLENVTFENNALGDINPRCN